MVVMAAVAVAVGARGVAAGMRATLLRILLGGTRAIRGGGLGRLALATMTGAGTVARARLTTPGPDGAHGDTDTRKERKLRGFG